MIRLVIFMHFNSAQPITLYGVTKNFVEVMAMHSALFSAFKVPLTILTAWRYARHTRCGHVHIITLQGKIEDCWVELLA